MLFYPLNDVRRRWINIHHRSVEPRRQLPSIRSSRFSGLVFPFVIAWDQDAFSFECKRIKD